MPISHVTEFFALSSDLFGQKSSGEVRSKSSMQDHCNCLLSGSLNACDAMKASRRRHSSMRSILSRPRGLSAGSFSSCFACASRLLSSRRIRSTAHRVMYLGIDSQLSSAGLLTEKGARGTTSTEGGRPTCPNVRVSSCVSWLWFCRRDCRYSGDKLMLYLCGWDSESANEPAARAHCEPTKTIISSKIQFLVPAATFLTPIR